MEINILYVFWTCDNDYETFDKLIVSLDHPEHSAVNSAREFTVSTGTYLLHETKDAFKARIINMLRITGATVVDPDAD